MVAGRGEHKHIHSLLLVWRIKNIKYLRRRPSRMLLLPASRSLHSMHIHTLAKFLPFKALLNRHISISSMHLQQTFIMKQARAGLTKAPCQQRAKQCALYLRQQALIVTCNHNESLLKLSSHMYNCFLRTCSPLCPLSTGASISIKISSSTQQRWTQAPTASYALFVRQLSYSSMPLYLLHLRSSPERPLTTSSRRNAFESAETTIT